jgi:predicted Holliday junction resolvase-like endonuclease
VGVKHYSTLNQNHMSKSKQMFTEMREQEIDDQYLDDTYQVQEWEWKSRERVSSKTQSDRTTLILNDLFSSFGEIFSDYENRKKTIE